MQNGCDPRPKCKTQGAPDSDWVTICSIYLPRNYI